MTPQTAANHSTLRTILLIRQDLQRLFQLVHGKSASPPGTLLLWLSAASPRYLPVLLYRISHSLFQHGFAFLSKLVSSLNFLIFGIEIAPSCPIGPGLFLPHTSGTVIGAWMIGSNVTIFQGVTLGARSLDFCPSSSTRPTICDEVTIGAGAKVLGGIVLGNACRVGANSVVLANIPDGRLAVGAPARVV